MVHFLSDLGHRVALKEVKAENMLPVSPSLAYRQMQEDFRCLTGRCRRTLVLRDGGSPVLYWRNIFAMCELNCRA